MRDLGAQLIGFPRGNFFSQLLGIDAYCDDKITRGWRKSVKRLDVHGAPKSRKRSSRGFFSFLRLYLVDPKMIFDEECPQIPTSERKPRFTVVKYIPVLDWLPQYTRLKAVSDLIAGITLGLTMIPQSMAYAVLAERIPQVL